MSAAFYVPLLGYAGYAVWLMRGDLKSSVAGAHTLVMLLCLVHASSAIPANFAVSTVLTALGHSLELGLLSNVVLNYAVIATFPMAMQKGFETVRPIVWGVFSVVSISLCALLVLETQAPILVAPTYAFIGVAVLCLGKSVLAMSFMIFSRKVQGMKITKPASATSSYSSSAKQTVSQPLCSRLMCAGIILALATGVRSGTEVVVLSWFLPAPCTSAIEVLFLLITGGVCDAITISAVLLIYRASLIAPKKSKEQIRPSPRKFQPVELTRV